MSANKDWEGISADYVNKSGTSMAAPHITGAALLLGDAGVTDPREIKALLINTADDWGTAGWDSTYGWGYVDLAKPICTAPTRLLYSVNESACPATTSSSRRPAWTQAKGQHGTYRHAVYNGASEPTDGVWPERPQSQAL